MPIRFLALILSLFAFAAPAFAADANPDVKGLYLLTDYPAVSVQPGTTATVNLKLRNYALAPERLALSVAGVPPGWTATLLGGGQPVAAAMPATDDSVSLDLRLDVPKDAKIGTHTLTVDADGGASHVDAAGHGDARQGIARQADAHPAIARAARLVALELRIHADHQERQRQEAGQPRAPTRRRISTPSFTEAYGSQQLTAIPVDAGKTKDVKLKGEAARHDRCRPLSGDRARRRRRCARHRQGRARHHRPAQASLAGREGLLSARATAGKESSVPVVVTNTGTAPAENIQLSGNAPSGWKITFEPKTIERIAPKEHKEVQALITPTEQGDRRRLRHDVDRGHRAARPAPRISASP